MSRREREEAVEPNTRTTLRRFVAVVRAFLPLAVAYARDRRRFLLFGGRREVDVEDRRRRAAYLLSVLLDLGPTFIKVGQILSTRPDVLPPAYIEELSSLQDEVPAADWSLIEPVVEAELGPVDEYFDDFDRTPISGASLGQVYIARHDGEKVAVKVLRPNIRERVEADLVVVETLLPLVLRFAPPGQAFTMENLADEFATTIRGEMNYADEAARLNEVRDNFADEPRVVVPPVVAERSTERVLTMEYVEGTKITDVDALESAGIDPSELVERLAEAYFRMIVEDGVFHADPHPGNLSVLDDGSIVFYDFGVVGRLSEQRRDQILDFYVGLARDDIDRVIDAFVEMGALDPDADRDLIREVFGLVIEQLRGQTFDNDEIQQYVREFQAAVGDVSDFPFRLPQDLALIVRVSTVLEGVTRTLDDDFDFITTVTDLVRERSGEEVSGLAREEIEGQARATVRGLLAVPVLADDVADTALRGGTLVNTLYADDPKPFRLFAARLALALGIGVGGLAATAMYVFGAPYAAAGFGVVVAFAALVLARTFRRPTNRGIAAGARVGARSVTRNRDR
ncbi:ABC1 kinase family protein [Halosegnis marinus]|uniref:ABC1 kinase family protein n=1 Tax=Halosegnis marinus TaxID=3034023 RepID=A0ABD5ZS60_9EURY|nr:AarF/ABC1/UbiB kinase family protein [Halosegnis sp. DT85]